MTKTQKLEAAKREAVLEIARAAVVDEAGALEIELAPWKLKLKRLEDLRKTIRGWYEHADPTKIFSAYGESYVATVGACGNETVIQDMSSVFEAAGKDKFLAACKLTMAKLNELIPAELASAVTTQVQTGTRGISIMSIRPGK
jgi:hypothetical protein